MKNQIKFLACLITVAACFYGCSAKAQTNSNPNFLQSAQDFFTHNNTNFTFSDCTVELSTGYKQVNGANAANELYGQINLGASKNFDVMLNIQFSGLGSAINAAELGFGYAVVNNHAIKVQADILAGWDATKGYATGKPNQGSLVIEPRLSLKKKLTLNTFAETAFSLPIYTIGKMNTQPSIYVGAGFTF